MPIVRNKNREQRSPSPTQVDKNDRDDDKDQEEEQEEIKSTSSKSKQVTTHITISKDKVDVDIDNIIPVTSTGSNSKSAQTAAQKPEVIKIERYKVSILDFDPERVVLLEPRKEKIKPKEKEEDKKDGDSKKKEEEQEFYAAGIEYDYPERQMYLPGSGKVGKYPSERGPLIIATPPWISEYGLRYKNNKYYAIYLVKPQHTLPDNLSKEERERLIKEYDSLPDIFNEKMDRMKEVLGQQVGKYYLQSKIVVEKILDDKKSKIEKKPVIREDIESIFADFIRYQQDKSEKPNYDLPKIFKLAYSTYRRNDVYATTVLFPDGEEIPVADWQALLFKPHISENDIHVHQVFANKMMTCIQLKARSVLLLEINERKSGTTQQDRAEYWSSHDSGKISNLKKTVQLALQKVNSDKKQKETATDDQDGGSSEPNTTYSGIINRKGNNPLDEIKSARESMGKIE